MASPTLEDINSRLEAVECLLLTRASKPTELEAALSKIAQLEACLKDEQNKKLQIEEELKIEREQRKQLQAELIKERLRTEQLLQVPAIEKILVNISDHLSFSNILNLTNCSEGFRQSVLTTTFKCNNVEGSKLLLNSWLRLNDQQKMEQGLLDAASSDGDRVIKLLLESGVGVNCNIYGVTPLHIAAAFSRVRACETLIGAGADVNVKGQGNRTPIHGAARKGDLTICKELVDAGAKVNVMDEFHTTPLHEAVTAGHIALVRFLVQNKADIFLKNHSKKNSIDLAHIRGHRDIAKFLESLPSKTALQNDNQQNHKQDTLQQNQEQKALQQSQKQ